MTETSTPNEAEKPIEIAPELLARARELFKKARDCADRRQWDYAIECYIQGLRITPDAVDIHKELRELAFRRRKAGGKGPGFIEAMKHGTSSRDPKRNLLNAARLLAKAPDSLSHMQAYFGNACKAECMETAQWVGSFIWEAVQAQRKPTLQQYLFLKEHYLKVQDYDRAMAAVQAAAQIKPNDRELQQEVKNVAAQQAMAHGRYDDGTDFRTSIKDADVQRKLQEQDQVVKSGDQIGRAIDEARAEYEAQKDEPGKILKFVDALSLRGEDATDNEAMAVLDEAYKATNSFRYRQRWGEIRCRQLERLYRRLRDRARANPDEADVTAQRDAALNKLKEAERAHYAGCVEAYPTDMRMRYELGVRHYRLEQFDEAIACFQRARNDAKNRLNAVRYTGRCFFQKGWYQEAIDQFREALSQHEGEGDELSKDLNYYLARSLEAKGDLEEAAGVYSRLAQADINYLDVRKRLEKLRKKQ